MPLEPSLLVVEANPRENCERAEAFGAGAPGTHYVNALRHVCPEARIEKIFGAEPDVPLPSGADLAAYDGVVLGGSGLHVYDDDVRVTRQIEFARAVFEAGVPFLGSCWGVQIAVVAAGGTVAACGYGREVGIARKIALTPEGAGHPLYRDKPRVFDSPCIHLDEVTQLPPDSVVLAGNRHSRVQAVSISYGGGTFWGVQYHPEFDLRFLARVARMYSGMMIEEGFFRNEDDLEAHAALVEALHDDPARRDLAWRLGVDRDVLDPDLRFREIRNWVRNLVMPRMLARA